MRSLLMNVQEFIDRNIKMMTAVFDFSVDVIDADLIRVAGTKDFQSDINKRLRFAHIFPTVISESRVIFISTTDDREECRSCTNKAICGDNARLYTPIILDGKVIGAISLRANSVWQNHELRKNVERYTEFIKTMADMISLNVKEYLNKQRLDADIKLQDALMNVITEGVMLLDSRHNILYMNKRCEYMLGCNLKQIKYLKKNKMFSIRQEQGQFKDNMTYNLKIREKRLVIKGHIHALNDVDSNEIKFVFTFSDMHSLQEELMLNQSVKSVTFSDLPCTSEIFKELVEKCKSAAYTGNPVMLVGERGTGKEMLAQAIHNEGLYRTGMFMATSHNTAQQELLEKTIFNRENVGSGQLQTSLSGNTLFVDDVASLSWEKQSRLLTIIQNSSRLHTQVICGTATDLKEQVDEGNFSPELYYELELYTLVVPPLRMRGSDLKIYINRFLDEANRSFGKNIKLSKELDQALQRYSWRGNLRELTNFIYRMVDAIPIEEDEATLENIPRALIQKLESDTTRSFDLREIEKRAIIEALNSLKTRGLTKQEIADELGIGVATLYRKLKDYGIEANTLYR